MASIKKRQTLSEIFGDIASGVTGFFVFVILTVFPIYTHNKYFDILSARYVFFKVWAILLCSILAIIGVLYILVDNTEHASSPTALKRLIDSFKIANIRKHFILTDLFFIIMIISMTISTIFSHYKEESFFGNAGRFQGLECWILYMLTYFAITRTFRFKRYYLDFAVVVGVFACIWGILDFFWLDPFQFFVNVEANQQGMFASSIGNLNTYTNYTIMIFALSTALFIVEKNIVRSSIYAIASLIACAGTIFGFADNAVLGFFGFYAIIPFFVLKNRRMLIKYLISIDILLLTIYIFSIALKFPHNNYQGSFFIDLVENRQLTFLFIPFTVFIVILAIVFTKLKPHYVDSSDLLLKPFDSVLPKQVLFAYISLFAIAFILVVYILVDMNVLKQHVELWKKMPSSYQLVFNDDWGTHRGHNWRIAFTNFTQNFSIFQRLFGYGPDTYLIVSERTFYEEMVNRYGEVYDSAHNEYINYLICEGLIGLIAYLGIFTSAIANCIKNLKNNIYILAPLMAVIAYLVQAFVNIAIPITTPVFFVLMYIMVAETINLKKLNNN